MKGYSNNQSVNVQDRNERPWRNPNNIDNAIYDSTNNTKPNNGSTSFNNKRKKYRKNCERGTEQSLDKNNSQPKSKTTMHTNNKYPKNLPNSFHMAQTTKAKS